ncbi:hypothetical protein CRX72_10040 [Pantoea sp. BRM17]|nr:hypothetical protein CRX72_10040 [Pantoea sp. BRM17]
MGTGSGAGSLGGTKTEVIALSDDGTQLFRHRVNTPRNDYAATVGVMADLVRLAEAQTGERGSVGVGIPGSISPYVTINHHIFKPQHRDSLPWVRSGAQVSNRERA